MKCQGPRTAKAILKNTLGKNHTGDFKTCYKAYNQGGPLHKNRGEDQW